MTDDVRRRIIEQARARQGLSVNGPREHTKTGLPGYRRRLFLRRETAEVVSLAPRLNLRNPFPSSLVQRHASMLRRCAGLTRHVLAVLSARRHSQVRAAVIETVAVDVVNLKAIAIGKPHQLAVKTEVLDPTSAAVGDVLSSNDVSVNSQAPTPLRRPFSIGAVDDRMSADHAADSAERNQSRSVPQKNGAPASPTRLHCAFRGAETGFAVFDTLQAGQEVAIAPFAGARNGTLLGHPEPPTRGVVPPDVASIAGASSWEFYHA